MKSISSLVISFLLISCNTNIEPKYFYENDHVKVVSGFYKGKTGRLYSKRDDEYMVFFDGFRARGDYIPSQSLELIKPNETK